MTTIYPAGALFNAADTYFNAKLVEALEKGGFETRFPQRDGFEFGNLHKAFDGKLPDDEIPSAVQDVIYLLDIGKFIPESDVIIARFDEPFDEGVIVEATFSHLIGKPVIGYRTDVRSPYGSPQDDFGGMHFFPAYQCDVFIKHYMPSKTLKQGDSELEGLAEKIKGAISIGFGIGKLSSQKVIRNKCAIEIIKCSRNLFQGIKNIHSKKGLNKIATRYSRRKKKLAKLRPVIVQ